MWISALFVASMLVAPEAEVARIRAHLLKVEADLRAETDPQAAQAATRLRDLDELHRYAIAGVFPHNHEVPGQVPVFMDEHGTPCAVGHLIIASGGRAYAEEIARTRLYARVTELADDPRLLAWADAHGFSVSELQRIQPNYVYYAPVTAMNRAGRDLCGLITKRRPVAEIKAFLKTMQQEYVRTESDWPSKFYRPERRLPLNDEQVDRVLTFAAVCAVKAKRTDVVTTLVTAGASLTRPVRPDKATEPDPDDVRLKEWEAEESRSPVSVAIEAGDVKMLTHMVRTGASFEGGLVVVYAIHSRRMDVLRAIATAPTFSAASREGIACYPVDAMGVDLRLPLCAPIHAAVSAWGKPRTTCEPLHLAAALGELEMVRFLLADASVPVNAPCELHRISFNPRREQWFTVTALDLAERAEHTSVVQLLRERGGTARGPVEVDAGPSNQVPVSVAELVRERGGSARAPVVVDAGPSLEFPLDASVPPPGPSQAERTVEQPLPASESSGCGCGQLRQADAAWMIAALAWRARRSQARSRPQKKPSLPSF